MRDSSQPELERGEPRLRADVLRGDLVDRDAVLDVGAGRLLRVDAGEVAGRRARVVAGAVAERVGVLVREAAQARASVAERLERLQDARELERRRRPLRRPVGHRHAVRDVGEDERSGRPAAAVPGLEAKAGVIASSIRQRHRGAQAPQERPPWQVLAGDDHGASARSPRRRIWNGRLLTISSTRLEKR